MDGFEAKIEGLDKLNAALEKRRALLANPAPLLERFGLYMMRSVRKNFREGGRPEKWEPSYRARTEGKNTLAPTGRHLMKSITYEVNNDGLRMGSNFIGARLLQLGGTIVPKIAKALRFPIGDRWVTTKKVKMPARPFLVIQIEDVRRMERMTDRMIQTGEV